MMETMNLEWLEGKRKLLNITELCRLAEFKGYDCINVKTVIQKLERASPDLTDKEKAGFICVLEDAFPGIKFQMIEEMVDIS